MKTHTFVFLLPAFLITTVFLVYPLFDSLLLSFYTETPSGLTFVGLQNYFKLFDDEFWSVQFLRALRNNAVFFLIHVLVQNPVGLALAAFLGTRNLRGGQTYRTLLYTPSMLSVVLVGFIWKLILSPLWGVTEGLFQAVGLGAYFGPWLGREGEALFVLALISVWQFIGVPMLLFYAALLTIPQTLLEAARIDGAGVWSVFWRIKFPLILPTVGIVTILTFIGNFNAFDLIYATQGVLAGPNFSTDILGTFFYRTFFGNQLQPGNQTMGATIAGVMFLIILLVVLLYLFLWQRRIQTYEF